MSTQTTFFEALSEFAGTLKGAFSILIPGQPEDQLKGPVQRLLTNGGAALNFEVASRTESRVADIEGRPDIGVTVRRLLCGHLELKAPGKGARTERFRGADKQQWEKFKALPNLVYTDGSEWALYRSGERKLLVRFDDDVTLVGGMAFTAIQSVELSDLVRVFLSWTPIVPSNPRGLAKILAPLCRLLRKDVETAIAKPESNLTMLAAEWRAYLFPDTDDAQFADAYAQTLTYALLLAKLSGDDRLSIDSAADAIQAGHRLLSQALRVLGQPEARADIELAVDLLVACL